MRERGKKSSRLSGPLVVVAVLFLHSIASFAQAQSKPPADVVERAREKLLESLDESTRDKVRVVGEPLQIPSHALYHRNMSKGNTAAPHAVPSATFLVAFQVDETHRTCGLHYVLVGDETVLLTESFAFAHDVPEQTLTIEECQKVQSGIDDFFRTAMEFQHGPDRFLPYLSDRFLVSDVFHHEDEQKLSIQERKTMLSAYFDMLATGQWYPFEDLPAEEAVREWEKEAERLAGSEKNQVRALLVFHGYLLPKLKQPLLELGVPEKMHLAAAEPIWARKRSLVDKHPIGEPTQKQVKTDKEYHVQWDVLDLAFVFESGKPELIYVRCRQ